MGNPLQSSKGGILELAGHPKRRNAMTKKRVVKKTGKKVKHKLGKTFDAWARVMQDGSFSPYAKAKRGEFADGGKVVRVRFVEVE